MYRRILSYGLAGALVVPPAYAATQTLSMGVAVTIVNGCVVNGGTLNFGTKGALSSVTDATATFSVNCSNLAIYTVALDQGLNGASVTARKMRGGASNSEFVNYNLYSDAARTTNFVSRFGIAIGSAQTYTVYGRVPVQTTPSAGTYTDTVTITLTY